jgi:hypothetical protein
MFPPPQPWKPLSSVQPDREYLAFTSRFGMRSWLRAPAFFSASLKIQKQVEAASGAVGYSLGAHLPGLLFYTLSVWEDEDSLRRFSRSLQHSDAMRAFHHDMRMPSPFIRWQVMGADLPLKWPEALERIRSYDESRGTAPAS